MQNIAFWHCLFFLFGAIIALIGSILGLCIGFPSPKWVLLFLIGASSFFEVSFFCGIVIPDQDKFVTWLYFIHSLGAFSLLLASIIEYIGVIYTDYVFLLGSLLLVSGVLFLLVYVLRLPKGQLRKSTATVLLFISIGTICLLSASIVTLWKYYMIGRVLTVICFLCFIEVGIHKFFI